MTHIKIKSIRKVGIRKTFDLEVEDNHNFILRNNIISHNSETKNLIDGNSDLILLGRLTAESDKEMATAQLYKDNLITAQSANNTERCIIIS